MGKGWIEMKCLREGEARVCPACNGSGLTPLEKDCLSAFIQHASRLGIAYLDMTGDEWAAEKAASDSL